MKTFNDIIHNMLIHPIMGILTLSNNNRLARLVHDNFEKPTSSEDHWKFILSVPLHHIFGHPLSVFDDRLHKIGLPTDCKTCSDVGGEQDICEKCPVFINRIGNIKDSGIHKNEVYGDCGKGPWKMGQDITI